MIKTTENGIKVIEYGYGDVYSLSLSNDDVVGIAFYTGEGGEIGRDLPKLTHKENMEIFESKTEVMLTFKNIESLDVVIKNLQSAREHFNYLKKKEENVKEKEGFI